MRKLLAAVVVLALLCPAIAGATIHTPGTCAQSTVEALVDGATVVDGDTVQLPACNVTWNNFTLVNKSITLIGAGIGQTILTSTASPPSSGNGSALSWTLKQTGNVPAGFSRLSGITFRGTGGSNGYAGGTIVTLFGSTENFVLDHVRIEASTSGGIGAFGRVNGVAYANEIICIGCGVAHQIQWFHTSWTAAEQCQNGGWGGPSGCGDSSWSSPSTWSGLENMFWEDNLIQSFSTDPYCTDDWLGARMVYRFNEIRNCSMSQHGTETGGRGRGHRYSVTYRNAGIWTQSFNWPGMFAQRGGTGVHFDDTVTCTGGGCLNDIGDLSTLRSNDDYVQGGHEGSYVFGRCGDRTPTTLQRTGSTYTATFPSGANGHYSKDFSYQSFTGGTLPAPILNVVTTVVNDTTITFQGPADGGPTYTGVTMFSPFDTPVAGYTGGYRCLDQAGAGQSIHYTGNAPNFTPNISPIAPGNSALEPILVWNETIGGTVRDWNLCPNSSCVPVVAANRDIYQDNRAGCAGASCTAGIGRGTTLPSACTTTATNSGPYFFDTDAGSWNRPGVDGPRDTADANGILYKCTAASGNSPGTWTVFYTPADYPHPLRLFVEGQGAQPTASKFKSATGGHKFTGAVRAN